MWYVCEVLYAVLYICVCCFVVRGCAVSRRYIDVCYCDMFSVVHVYLDHLKWHISQKSISSHPTGPHGRLAPKTVIGHPLLGAGGVDIIFHTTVTAQPRVGCVFWSLV